MPWTEMNFLNQIPCMPSRPGFFLLWYFFSVTLSYLSFMVAKGKRSTSWKQYRNCLNEASYDMRKENFAITLLSF